MSVNEGSYDSKLLILLESSCMKFELKKNVKAKVYN